MTTKRVSDFIVAFQYQTEQPAFRGRLIVDLCRRLKLKAPRIVEVGVFTGALSAYLLRELPTCTLLMVDLWQAYATASDDEISTVNDREMLEVMDHACKSVAFAADRVIVRRASSIDAAVGVLDGSCDIVFLDADHHYEAVVADIAAWWPKVKPNGVLCGHDWGYPATSVGVERAVREFVDRMSGLKIQWSLDYTWIIQKRTATPGEIAEPAKETAEERRYRGNAWGLPIYDPERATQKEASTRKATP